MDKYLSLINENNTIVKAQIEYRKQKRLEKQAIRNIKLQKLVGVLFLISSVITFFYLMELTSTLLFLTFGIGLIRAKKQYIEF